MDTFDTSPIDERPDSRDLGEEDTAGCDGLARKEAVLREIRLLVPVLESERDRLVSGDWEGLESVLEEKSARSRSLSEALAGLLPEDLAGQGIAGREGSLRSALLHLEELASVNLAIARESSMIVEHVLREINLDSQGQLYGASGTVGPGLQSPALVSTRG